MSIQDFCKNFTDVFDARLVPPSWQCGSVTCSAERPSYPLVSVAARAQALFVLTQTDRRWTEGGKDYVGAIGLRVYRCRIVAPPQNAVGVRQNVSSPFNNLEMIAERPAAKVHSVFVELPHLEPDCLYIAAMEATDACTYASLRVLTACLPRFRELSAPESSYFLQAQAAASPALDTDSFSSQGSAEVRCVGPAPAPGPRVDPMRRMDGNQDWSEWPPDTSEAIKVPYFLQVCMASCSGEC